MVSAEDQLVRLATRRYILEQVVPGATYIISKHVAAQWPWEAWEMKSSRGLGGPGGLDAPACLLAARLSIPAPK